MSKRHQHSQSAAIKSSEITAESSYLNRRKLVQGLGLGLGLRAGIAASASLLSGALQADIAPSNMMSPDEEITPEKIATSYNNFYEFGTGKEDPAEYAHEMSIAPWQVEVSGEVEKQGVFDYTELLQGLTVEERIYRLRCVEAWSMVIPWQGVPLAALLQRLQPTSAAKYVHFTTLHRPKEMRGQRSFFSGIDWPYVEGLRLDEAMHPLTLMATGMYGKSLPNQNGAPWRLVVPWKYGFKSIKSIVKIHFSKREPKTTWNQLAPSEYGFYANVNPDVSHPRWSQASERRLPGSLFGSNRIPTLPFNGYGEQVAGLYAGMNLKRHY